MRWRTPIGGLILLAGLIGYAAAAVTLADGLPDNGLVEALYYLAAGLLWIPPAVAVIGWTKRDDGG
ncbi:MAG: DUF2842 domain-containing protein [Alphaproteobacteria bacterium]|nr:DUF2842 domain-containing protein [Alphaproteobacteria bacterium]